MPRDAFAATALEMLVGGLVLLPIGLLATDFDPAEWSTRSILGWWYLVFFGSLVGYTAYVWLLQNAPISKVATYAYVNPVVAIALGALVLHEEITWRIALGAAIVLASVAVVVRRESVPAEAEAAPAGAGRVSELDLESDVVGAHRNARQLAAGRVPQRRDDRRGRDHGRRLADALDAVGRVRLGVLDQLALRPAACRARSGSGSR